MRFLTSVLAIVAAFAVLATACGGRSSQAQTSAGGTSTVGVEDGTGTNGEDSLVAPEGYRAELQQTPWVLDGVSNDGTAVWITTVESGCNSLHHVRVTEVAGGFRLVAFDVVHIPTDEHHGCLVPLFRPRHRVELPRPLGSDTIFGECIPSDPGGMCAALRDPWLG